MLHHNKKPYQCSLSVWRKAESPSINTKMATVNVAQKANIRYMTMPPAPPSPPVVRPIRSTIPQRTSLSSANTRNGNGQAAATLGQQNLTFPLLLKDKFTKFHNLAHQVTYTIQILLLIKCYRTRKLASRHSCITIFDNITSPEAYWD